MAKGSADKGGNKIDSRRLSLFRRRAQRRAAWLQKLEVLEVQRQADARAQALQ